METAIYTFQVSLLQWFSSSQLLSPVRESGLSFLGTFPKEKTAVQKGARSKGALVRILSI